MCLIQAGYFTVNGSSPQSLNCTAKSTDTVNIECSALFGPAENGQQYKAELKMKLPTGAEFSFYTPYKTVTGGQISTFTSEKFVSPTPTGTYGTVWFVIYDTYGNTICSGNGKGSGLCENITVSSAVTPATVNVVVQNGTGGNVDVYRNNTLIAIVATSQVISYNVGDSFKFTARPFSGYTFTKFCTDANCSQSTTSNPFSGTITQTSGNLYAFFTQISTTQPPTTQPPTTQPPPGGTTPPPPVQCNPSTQINIPSIGCVPKIYVVGGAAAFLALMLLRR